MIRHSKAADNSQAKKRLTLPGCLFIKSSQLSIFSIAEVEREGAATPPLLEGAINLAGRKAELPMASKSSEAAAWENPRETMAS